MKEVKHSPMRLWIHESIHVSIANQRRLIYGVCTRPRHHLPSTAFNLPPLQRDGDVYRFVNPKPHRQMLHFFHGNGACVEDCYWHLGRIYSVCNCSITAYAYLKGDSEYETIKRVDMFLLNSNSSFDHIVMGVSLGTIIASQVNLMRGIFNSHKTILENPFTSLYDMVPWPLGYLLFDTWNNTHSLDWWPPTGKMLILASEKDEIVPSYMPRTLAKLFPSDTTYVLLDGANHGDAGAHPKYLDTIKQFLEE